MDHPVAILPIACRRPSTLSLTFNPRPFWSAAGLSPDGHGRGTPAQPCAFRGFSYVLLQLEGPTQFFQFGRIVGTEPCPKSPTGALPFVLSFRSWKDRNMPDKSITKVSSEYAPKGRLGQKYLASGIHISMRFWEREQPAAAKPQTARDYETVGLVLEGKAELLN